MLAGPAVDFDSTIEAPVAEKVKLLHVPLGVYDTQPYAAAKVEEAIKLSSSLAGKELEFIQWDVDVLPLSLVDFASPGRPWGYWRDELKAICKEVNGMVRETNCRVVLSGKAPISTFVSVGQLLGIFDVIIVNQSFDGTWQVFEMDHQAVGESVLKCAELGFKANTGNGEMKVSLLFTTLDARYTLTQEQVDQISTECDVEIVNTFRLSPVDESFKPLPMLPTNVAQIRKSVDDAFSKIYETPSSGILVVSTGPQPVAYLHGLRFKPNLYGRLITAERVGATYQLAF